MNYFECCRYCVAPKRYPGCSGKCPEYAAARARYDKDKARHTADTEMRTYTINQVLKNKDKTSKRKRDVYPYKHL